MSSKNEFRHLRLENNDSNKNNRSGLLSETLMLTNNSGLTQKRNYLEKS